MGSVLNRLTEIEETAASIVNHAEEEKESLNREYDEKTKCFDEALQERIRATDGCFLFRNFPGVENVRKELDAREMRDTEIL